MSCLILSSFVMCSFLHYHRTKLVIKAGRLTSQTPPTTSWRVQHLGLKRLFRGLVRHLLVQISTAFWLRFWQALGTKSLLFLRCSDASWRGGEEERDHGPCLETKRVAYCIADEEVEADIRGARVSPTFLFSFEAKSTIRVVQLVRSVCG